MCIYRFQDPGLLPRSRRCQGLRCDLPTDNAAGADYLVVLGLWALVAVGTLESAKAKGYRRGILTVVEWPARERREDSMISRFGVFTTGISRNRPEGQTGMETVVPMTVTGSGMGRSQVEQPGGAGLEDGPGLDIATQYLHAGMSGRPGDVPLCSTGTGCLGAEAPRASTRHMVWPRTPPGSSRRSTARCSAGR